MVRPSATPSVKASGAGREGRLEPIVGAVRPLAEAPAAFAPDRRTPGKTIIRIIEGG